ncbi:hypothetical protein [Flavihumibacter sp. ZG627]|uniref:hypothetical protein n=1 Tax=Flavihumibacter sp. ZG627 TaxID=1463156 RepID=UPI00057D8336|nr:hypothetical protein [Flavihumibacter sp. ZG627]KIC89217.1 hypothetical protein HY58_18370 [Flavihumibacter sp. ZG627]
MLFSFELWSQQPIQSSSLNEQLNSFNISDRFLATLKKKALNEKSRMEKLGSKYFDKIKNEEKKLYRKLYKKDSLQARSLFGNVDSVYNHMKAEASIHSLTSGPREHFYNGRLDSLQTTLKFLSLDNSNIAEGVPSNLSQAKEAYQRLQAQFTQSTYLEQALLARRQAIASQLSNHPLAKELKAYHQQVQYYQQQLRQAREWLDQPDVLANKLLSYASRLPLFRAFMEKHSAFAAIFPTPDPTVPLTGLGGLQTRTALQTQMGSSLGIANPQAQLQQGLGQAEQELRNLKDKLSQGQWGDAGEMPAYKTNEQTTKSLWQRLEWGSNLQSTRSNNYFPTTSDLGLSLGYKLNQKSILGIGASYKLGLGRDWRHVRLTHEGMGLRSFLDWKLKGSFWVSGGAELNHRNRIEDLALLKQPDNWQQSALVGITRKFKVGKMQSDARLLYDFLSARQVPRTQPLVFRIGYTFK